MPAIVNMQAHRGLLGLCALYMSLAMAVDIVPGEIRPLPDGKRIVLGGVTVSGRDARFVGGQKQSADVGIETITAFARIGSSFKVADQPAAVYVQLPYRTIRLDGSLSSRPGDAGIGDAVAVGAYWPYTDFAAQRFLAIAAYLTLPTGDYVPERIFNVGGNRVVTSLQAGYHAAFTENLSGMVTLDATWFGDNKALGAARGRLEQRVLYASHVAAVYKINPKVEVAAGWLYSAGGETLLNGVARNDVTRLHRAQLTGSFAVAGGRLQVQYGTTLKTENGFRENQFWLLRYAKPF